MNHFTSISFFDIKHLNQAVTLVKFVINNANPVILQQDFSLIYGLDPGLHAS